MSPAAKVMLLVIAALLLALLVKNSECAGTHYVYVPDYREPID